MYSVHEKRVSKYGNSELFKLLNQKNSQCNFWIESNSPYSNQIEFDLD